MNSPLPFGLRRKKERNELGRQRFFAKQLVDPVQAPPCGECSDRNSMLSAPSTIELSSAADIPLPETSARTPTHSPELSCRKS